MSEEPARGETEPAKGSSGRGELLATLVVVLVGALLVLLASTRPWAEVLPDPTLSVPPPLQADLSGAAVAPAARALGLVVLAAAVALVATRRVGRRIVGVAMVLAGLGIVVACLVWGVQGTLPVGAGIRTRVTLWPGVSVIGGLLSMAGGAWAAVRSARWPTMGARYDRSTGSPSLADAWSAMDRGEDPTR